MKRKQSLVPPLILLVAGLLMVAVASLINHFLQLPDFVKGTLAGFGIGIEIVAVVKLIKLKQVKNTNVPS
jgi:uncharacterized membrane protein YoaK (UPF0700 family)